MPSIPAAETRIDEALVEHLLAEQCPGLAGLPLSRFQGGWDNEHYRVGESLLVRLPRRASAVPLLVNELRWLPVIGPRLSSATPLPVFTGRPAADYPWPWCIVGFIDGVSADQVPVAQRSAAAEALADFFIGLHVPAPLGAPDNPHRGLSLDQEHFHRKAAARIARVPEHADDLRARWAAWSSAAEWDRPDLWIHGDPHPMNLILDGGQLAGVVDWGDMTSGDPASDLATAWMMFDADARRVFVDRANLGGWYDDATWDRAKAWALWFALLLSQHCDDMPSLRAVGEHTLRELLDEPSPTAG